jgi:putative peptidoglycan lipid II flippase
MDKNEKVSRAAGSIGSMTLFSRIFGFIRDLVIAMSFGTSAAADAFFVAFRVPNIQRRILGEGGMNAAFIPVFSEYLATEKVKEGWDFCSKLFLLLSITLGLVSLIIFIFASPLISVLAPGFAEDANKFQLTVHLTEWMSGFLFFIGLSAFFTAILNTKKVFTLPAFAPVLLNICIIASAIWISPKMDEPVMGLAIGVLIGGLLQVVMQWPLVRAKGLRFTFNFDLKHSGIVKFGKLMIPAVLGVAVYEINILIDTLLASLLPGGSISYLYYGNRLVQLPLGVFAVALGAAILPTLSDQAAQKDLDSFKKTVSFGVRLVLFVTIPATCGLIILRFPIVNTLWERGEFLRLATDGTSQAILCYSVGLCAFAGLKILTAAFYSLQDAKTPAIIGACSMLVNVILNLILMGPLQHAGLALATSIAAIFNCLALLIILKKRLGRLEGSKIWSSTQKLIVASGIMTLVVYFLNEFLFNPSDSLLIKLASLFFCIFSGVACFILVSRILKNEEWDFIRNLRGKQTSKA